MTWATGEQTTGDTERVADLLDAAFDPANLESLGEHRAVVVVQGGRIVAERYGRGLDARSTHLSWSVAKSVTHAAAGILVRHGLLDPSAPVLAPEWVDDGDPRAAITLDHLLEMRSGLHFVENYVDDAVSNCLEMLFGAGADDVAGYAASQPLEHPVGEVFNYSSGTTNIVVRHLARLLGADHDAPAEQRRDAVTTLLERELFEPLGMGPVELRFDTAGTFVGSSYLYATARDYARFGLLHLRDGVWDSRRILPEGWVDDARTIRSRDADNGWYYGRHWWVRGDDVGTFWANGYDGQMVACVPALDLVFVRLGRMPTAVRPATEQFFFDLLDAFGRDDAH
ncbi:MAG: serine hydrolase domain-containing protein [Microthrixaceae bacterium]